MNIVSSYWFVNGDQLIVSAGSKLVYPDAETVYRIFIENESLDNYPAQNYQKSLPQHFSSFPLNLQVQLCVDTSSSKSQIILKCNGVLDALKIPIQDFITRKTDHAICDNTWYPFVRDSLDHIQKVIRSLDITSPGNLTIKKIIELKKISLQDSHFIDLTNDIENPISFFPPNTSDEIPSVNATLYPYQLQGWKWLRFIARERLGAILADEMGLGKTLQIISLLASEKSGSLFPSLIVAPSTLLENWRREILKFSPAVSCQVHQGALRTGNARDLLKNNVTIASYDTVVRDYSLFNQVDWKIMILDEAQAIKNPDAKRTLTIKKLKRQISLAVTGTPVENTLRDIWSLFDFVLSGYLGSLPEFERSFENSADGAAKLEPYVRPLLLRRKIADVARDLPPRIDIPQILAMPSDEALQYEIIRQQAQHEFQKNASLVSLIRLRQFCTHPFLLNNLREDPLLASEKYKRLSEILEEIFSNAQKVIIFTSFQEMSDLLRRDLSRRFDIYGNGIDGRTPVPDRQKIVDEFTSISGSAFLALNPKAAGAGLNITAANHVIHYNLEWNPATEDQASARAHRRGQTLPVTIHRLFYADTVEDSIDARLARKRNIAGSVVTGVEGKDEDYNDMARALNVTPLTGTK